MHCLAHPWNYIYILTISKNISSLLYNFVVQLRTCENAVCGRRLYTERTQLCKASCGSHLYTCTYIYVNIHTYIQTDRHTYIRIYIYVYIMVITATGLEPPSLTAIYLVQSIYIYMYTHVCVFDTY